MKSNDRLENEKTQKFHYLLIGDNIKKVLAELDAHLNFYRFIPIGPFRGNEIIYDVPSNLMSNAGLVLSKQFSAEEAPFFKVRKISKLSGGYKRASQKFFLGECERDEQPKDFPLQIANAISNSYANVFTIDLVSVVRQTIPKIEINVSGRKYSIVGGFGFKGVMLHENAVYKDISTKKKVSRVGVTFELPKDKLFEKNVKEILEVVDHYCKQLVPFESSRFEIAQRLLYPEPTIEIKKEE